MSAPEESRPKEEISQTLITQTREAIRRFIVHIHSHSHTFIPMGILIHSRPMFGLHPRIVFVGADAGMDTFCSYTFLAQNLFGGNRANAFEIVVDAALRTEAPLKHLLSPNMNIDSPYLRGTYQIDDPAVVSALTEGSAVLWRYASAMNLFHDDPDRRYKISHPITDLNLFTYNDIPLGADSSVAMCVLWLYHIKLLTMLYTTFTGYLLKQQNDPVLNDLIDRNPFIRSKLYLSMLAAALFESQKPARVINIKTLFRSVQAALMDGIGVNVAQTKMNYAHLAESAKEPIPNVEREVSFELGSIV